MTRTKARRLSNQAVEALYLLRKNGVQSAADLAGSSRVYAYITMLNGLSELVKRGLANRLGEESERGFYEINDAGRSVLRQMENI